MPSLEFEVWCSCGQGLCSQCEDVKGGISVEPCEKCLKKARDEGYDDGHDTGYSEGYSDKEKEVE